MWPRQKTLSFIEDFRNAGCLWDVANIDYKNVKKKGCAVQCISNKHEMSAFAVNKKIENLRCQFRREYKKQLRFKNNGTSLNMTTWFAYEPLSFLIKYVEATERRLTIEDDLPLVNDEIVESSVKEEHSARSTPRSCEEITWVETLEETETSVTSRRLRQSKEINGKKRVRSVDNEKEAAKHLETLTETTTKRDDFSVYGELIASKFRSSGRNSKEIAIAQYHIEQVCFNLIMGVYGNEYRRFHESQSSTPMPTSSSNLDDIAYEEATSQSGIWMETLKYQS